MKKLLRLSIAVVCMGCDDHCAAPTSHPTCYEDPADPCGFLQVWDECYCECDWIF